VRQREHAAAHRVPVAHHDRVEIASLSPTRLGDVLGDIERVAAGIGEPEHGTSVRRGLETCIRDLTRRASLVTRSRVVALEWIDPLMIGGTWMPELVELAGGQPVGVTAGAPAPTISPSDLIALAPDVVVVKPCGFSLERALAEQPILERNVLAPLAGRARVYVTEDLAWSVDWRPIRGTLYGGSP
jgi:iron complex transport system substrate-binding protein